MEIHKYIYGAGALVVIGLVTTILRLKADTALAKNARQASAIERLHRLDAKKDALLADIANQLSAIHINVQKKAIPQRTGNQ